MLFHPREKHVKLNICSLHVLVMTSYTFLRFTYSTIGTADQKKKKSLLNNHRNLVREI